MRRTEGFLFVALLGALTALPPLSIDLSLPGLPEIARALDAPHALVQWTLSAFILGFALGQPILGPLSDRIGRRPVLLAGLAAYAAAGLACSFAANAPMLVALRGIQGVAACSGVVCARAVVVDAFDDRARAATVQAYLSVLNSLAPLVAPAIGTVVLATLGWRALYGTLGVAGIALLGIVAVRLPETSPRVAHDFKGAYRTALALSQTLPIAAIAALTFGAFFAIIASSPFALVAQLRLSAPLFAGAFAVNAAATLVGAFVSGRIVGRLGSSRVLAVGIALMTCAGSAVAAVDAFVPSIGGFVATMAAFGFAYGLVSPTAYGLALADARDAAGTVAGIVGAAQMLGGAAGSAIVAVVPLLPTNAVAAIVLPTTLAIVATYVTFVRHASAKNTGRDAGRATST